MLWVTSRWAFEVGCRWCENMGVNVNGLALDVFGTFGGDGKRKLLEASSWGSVEAVPRLRPTSGRFETARWKSTPRRRHGKHPTQRSLKTHNRHSGSVD